LVGQAEAHPPSVAEAIRQLVPIRIAAKDSARR
jgi:hypothetical protein